MSLEPRKAGVEALPVERLAEPRIKAPEAWPEAREVKPSKMAPQEELTLKITEGLSTLSDLLGSIDDKLATQNRQAADLGRRLEALPPLLEGLARSQKAGLDTMQDVQRTLEVQAKTGQETAQSVSQLPGLVEGLGARIDRQAQAGTQLSDSVESVGRSVRSLADGSQRAHNTLLAEFRRAQDEHGKRLADLVNRGRATNVVVAILGVLVVAGLVLVIVRS